ncbi:N-acetyltransferase domain-containing protein [Nocardia ninae]
MQTGGWVSYLSNSRTNASSSPRPIDVDPFFETSARQADSASSNASSSGTPLARRSAVNPNVVVPQRETWVAAGDEQVLGCWCSATTTWSSCIWNRPGGDVGSATSSWIWRNGRASELSGRLCLDARISTAGARAEVCEYYGRQRGLARLRSSRGVVMRKSNQVHHEVAGSAPFQLAVRVGLVAYGVVHLLVAWVCVQVALGDLDGDGVGKADKTGALQNLAENSGGEFVLWLIAVGLGVAVLWQLLETFTGARNSRKQKLLRAMNFGEAVLFGSLAYSAAKLANGSPASSTDQAQLGLIGSLLSKEWGKPVVIVIGLAIVVAGLFVARHGWSKRFHEEQDFSNASRSTERVVIRLGRVGYAALGGVYAGAGVLVIVAAVQSQPQKATGLDVALKTLAAEPYGTVLLLIVAVGLAAFAIFTFLDARFRKVH